MEGACPLPKKVVLSQNWIWRLTHISQLMFLEVDLQILIREWYWLRSTRLLTFDHQLNCLKSGGKSEEFALNTSWGLGVASRGEFLEEVAPGLGDTRIPQPLFIS